MARVSIIEDKIEVAKVLRAIGNRPTRITHAPTSYHVMRQLHEHGYLKPVERSKDGRVNRELIVSPKGKKLVEKLTRKSPLIKDKSTTS